MFANHHQDADSMFTQTVRDCLEGNKIESLKDISHEQLGYTTILEQPLRRIVANPNRPLNLVTALARFTWLMAGNNRLEDIAFYEPKVKGYTDNGLTVPGSSYGARLSGSGRPGSNQIASAIRRLRHDSFSRQASAVVWTPEDATCEDSRDIPCEFGMFFHVRDNGLQMINVMRSNNAFRLLPFNVFEFTMLGEVVAAELGVSFDRYTHIVSNMHVLKGASAEWKATLAVADQNPGTYRSYEMPQMPSNSWALALEMARYEAKLRHASSTQEVRDVANEATIMLGKYWAELFFILVAYRHSKFGEGWLQWLNPENHLHQIACKSINHMLVQAIPTAVEPKHVHRPGVDCPTCAGSTSLVQTPFEPIGGDIASQAFLDAVTSQPSGNPYTNIDDEDD